MIRNGNVQSRERPDAAVPTGWGRRRLWQTLNPLHRKYVYILARALALRQQPRLRRDAEPIYRELSQHMAAIERLLEALEPRLSRCPPRAVQPVDFEDPPA